MDIVEPCITYSNTNDGPSYGMSNLMCCVIAQVVLLKAINLRIYHPDELLNKESNVGLTLSMGLSFTEDDHF